MKRRRLALLVALASSLPRGTAGGESLGVFGEVGGDMYMSGAPACARLEGIPVPLDGGGCSFLA